MIQSPMPRAACARSCRRPPWSDGQSCWPYWRSSSWDPRCGSPGRRIRCGPPPGAGRPRRSGARANRGDGSGRAPARWQPRPRSPASCSTSGSPAKGRPSTRRGSRAHRRAVATACRACACRRAYRSASERPQQRAGVRHVAAWHVPAEVNLELAALEPKPKGLVGRGAVQVVGEFDIRLLRHVYRSFGAWRQRFSMTGWSCQHQRFDHHTCEAWAHVAKVGDRFAALRRVYDAVIDRHGTLSPDVARGVQVRHDWGSQYRSADFTGSLAWLGIADSPASPNATAAPNAGSRR